MCGFAGEVLFGQGSADLACARRMAQTLRHRGPDQSGATLSGDGRCAIGFQRLAVIDPEGSAQPMTLPDGSLTVAFNGEIYNFQSLRAELAREGARFTTAGDTEVLLHLFARDGVDMLGHLEGMFAVGIYDNRRGELMLARDRVGQKPLWYAVLADRIVFGSEAKALLCHPGIGQETDRISLTHYLTVGYIPSPRSTWAEIRKLAPGCRMTIGREPSDPQRYWTPVAREAAVPPAGTADVVREEITRAVRARMLADVPMGALLSGGTDSAIVVAVMAAAAGQCGGVRTFTAGFEDPQYDERSRAERVARHCGTDHTEIVVHPDPARMLDRVVAMYDEPFADSSAVPTFLICQAARRHVTVAVGGDGGDEVFAGYDRYRAMGLAEGMGWAKYLGVRIAAALARPFAPVHERSRARRLIRFADGLGGPFALQYLRYRALFAPEELPRLLTDEFQAGIDIEEPARWFCDLYEDCDLATEVARAQRHDLLTYLPDDLLVKTDIASMACSLELRAPMLDPRVVDLGLSLPVEAKIAGGRGKAVLARAFKDMLPVEVFQGPKRGFSVPLGRWLRGELRGAMKDTLRGGPLVEQRICRPHALAGLVNDHLAGRDDHSHRLWALMVLSRWLARVGAGSP